MYPIRRTSNFVFSYLFPEPLWFQHSANNVRWIREKDIREIVSNDHRIVGRLLTSQLSMPKTLTHKMEGVNMAVDIKRMVDAICSLTVLELSKLVKALRDKFGLRTSVIVRENANKVAEEGAAEVAKESIKSEKESNIEEPNAADEVVDAPIDEQETEAVSGEPAEVAEEPPEVVEQRFNPDLDDFDSSWTPTNKEKKNIQPPPPKPKGEDYDLVYAWRWSNDDRYAKIGRSSKNNFKSRLVTTYHPTDDPIVIGYRKCADLQHAEDLQNHILEELKRTRSDREWVKIDKAFEKMINLSFIKGYPE